MRKFIAAAALHLAAGIAFAALWAFCTLAFIGLREVLTWNIVW